MHIMNKYKAFTLLILAIFLIFQGNESVNSHIDEILSLPGLTFKPNFRSYSGYVQSSANNFLHYWFVTSQGDPANDPLIFWFNGGPGCSSIDGLLNEMGPYQINPDGRTLRKNPNAWNKYASVVYIEAPAGVGYSYSTSGNLSTNDDKTAAENYQAIKSFFAKFPEFRNNDAYITGESYAGIYVPTLTSLVVKGMDEFKINLKGVAIGNGLMDWDLNMETTVRFAYAHGLVDEKVWNTLELECCHGCFDGCDVNKLQDSCLSMVIKIYDFVWGGYVNTYDLYRDCETSSIKNSPKWHILKQGLIPSIIKLLKKPPHSMHHSQTKKIGNEEGIPCLNDTALTTYMNEKSVRKALNIPDNLASWEICSKTISSNYKKIYDTMAPFIKEILASKTRILLYYGDTDLACNFLMGQQFSDRLGLKRSNIKTPWKFDGQIAGFKNVYDAGMLTFLTVRGAGHMAPQWRAPQVEHIIKQFLNNEEI